MRNIIPIITMPQLTPAFMFAMLLIGSLSSNWLALTVAIIFSTLIQIVTIIIFIYWKRGTDIFFEDRTKRAPLFLIGIIAYSIGAILLFYINAPFIVTALMLAYAINSLAAAAITLFYKVSIHTWGISGPTVALFYMYGIAALMAGIVIALLVGFSRVRANAHTTGQVLLAILVSMPLTYLVIYYLSKSIIR